MGEAARAVHTIPAFVRIEVLMRGKRDVRSAAVVLRELAAELEAVASTSDSEEAAVILSHHKIRAKSKILRSARDAD